MSDPSVDTGLLRGEASGDHHFGGPERPSQAATTSSYRGMRRRGTPLAVRKDRHGRLLVVHEWRAAVKTPSFHTVSIVDGAATEVMEGSWEGVRVEIPTHPFG